MSQNTRKEPTFGESSNSETAKQMALNLQAPSVSLSSNQAPSFTFTPVETPASTPNSETAANNETNDTKETAETKTQAENSTQANVTAERVIPAASGNSWRKPEEWKALNKVPSKHRRLVVVVLLALLVPFVLWLLKPSAPETTVNDLQQNTNVPIEFRPVNEEEAKRLEEEARLRAEQEALAQQQAQQAQTVTPDTVTQQSATVETAPQQTATATSSQNSLQNNTQTAPAVISVEQETPVVAVKPSVSQNNQSVIHQSENSVKEKPQPKPATKPTAEKKADSTQAKNIKKEQQLDSLIKEVNKPAASATTASNGSKTLTVPKGVSLMQVFRDNQLNISDVNAMSKASGANNVLSSFKPGDKVNVRLDKNNRVTEMSLSSGGKFVRQADGSYKFVK